MQENFGVSEYKAVKKLLEGIDRDTEESIRRLQGEKEKHLAKAEDRSRKANEGSNSIAREKPDSLSP